MQPEFEHAVALTRRGNRASLEKALGSTQQIIFSFSMKLCGQRQDAENTVQEVMAQSRPWLPAPSLPVLLARMKQRAVECFVPVLLALGILAVAGIGTPSIMEAARNPNAGQQTTSIARGISTADLRKGRRLFVRDCAHCHGNNGDGNSPVRRTLHPTPLDLTGFDLTETYILNVLHEGVPGSDMPAWHSSPEQDLRTVSAYTARLGRPAPLPEKDRYAPPDLLQEAGRRIYVAHCARCHGESGKGDGKDATRYRPGPPSFAGMRPSYGTARDVIEKGVSGTAMASWPLLTLPEIQAVTYYIRSLYADGQAEPPGRTGARQ